MVGPLTHARRSDGYSGFVASRAPGDAARRPVREPDVVARRGLAAGSAAATMLAAPESVSQPSAEFEMFTPDDELDLMFEPGLIPDSMKDD